MKHVLFLSFLLISICSFCQNTPVYLDPNASINDRVEDLIARMTLDEKIGQMTQGERQTIESYGLGVIHDYYIGSVLSGGGSVPVPNNVESWVEMYNKMQTQAVSTRLGIPILYGLDAVHGHNNLKGAVIFPHNIGMGCTNNTELVEQCARITAVEVSATGVDWTFSPCVTVPQNEFWGRTYEGFGEEPDLVKEMSRAAVLGYQGNTLGGETSILACAKHFVGDGGTKNGVDQGNTKVSEQQLRQIHLPPFISSIDAGVGSIMISYSSWNDVKCHGSKYLITDVLKTELGFDGIVISDWGGIDQLNSNFDKAVETAINAGIDMAMQPYNFIEFITTLKNLVIANRVSMTRINDAVRRILRIKFMMGLFENSFADLSKSYLVGSAAHREVATQAVKESVVLLKNDFVLPLPKSGKTILVAGGKAKDVGAMCGGWSITWQGALGEITEGTTIFDGLQKASSNTLLYTDYEGNIPDADYAVVVVGENPYAEGQGDIAWWRGVYFTLSPDERHLISAIKEKGIPMVVVLLSGRPLEIANELNMADAFLAAWLPGTEGGTGIAEIIFGDYAPTGTLTHSWPATEEDVPFNILSNNSGKQALFPYGFGLQMYGLTNGITPVFSGIDVFPNPVSEYLFIHSYEKFPATICLTDIMGRTVLNVNLEMDYVTQIPVNNLKKGIYMLTLSSKSKIYSCKVNVK